MRVIRLLLKGLLLVVPLAILLVQVNYRVDGSAILRGDKYELEIAEAWLNGQAVGKFNNSINERSIMRLYVDNLEQPLGTLVLGSSRAMQITAEIAGEQVSFFNAGMTGADHRDIMSTFYLFDRAEKLPGNLVIAVDPWLFFDSEAVLNFRSDENLYKEFLSTCLGYDVEFVPEDNSLRQEALTSPAYFQENVLYYFSDHSDQERPEILPNKLLDYDYDIRTADGTQWYEQSIRTATQEQVDVAALTLANVDYAQLYGYTQVSDELAQQFEDFVAYAQSRGVKVTFVLTPFHPTYWELKVSVDENYTGVAAAEQMLRDMAARQGIDVYGSYDPAAAGCANADFYDGLHIRRESIYKYFPGVGQPLPVAEETAQPQTAE